MAVENRPLEGIVVPVVGMVGVMMNGKNKKDTRRNMSKRKEIKCFMNPKYLSWLNDGKASMPISNFEDSEFTTKATLIIDLPEKEIKLTESQFDELFHEHEFDMIGLCQVKRTLFGSEADVPERLGDNT